MAEIDIVTQIKKLIELQEMDTEIFKFKRELESHPEKIKNLDDALREKEGLLKHAEEELTKIQLKRKEKEGDLKSKEEAVKTKLAQLYQVKTNKEYQAMQKEIESAKADISILEEDIIKLLDEIETFEKSVSGERNVFNQDKQKIEAEESVLEERKNQATEELNKLNVQREGFVKDIDKNVLSKYERILYNKDGLALAKIEGDACSGCNMNLPPQVVNEAKMRKDLLFCGNCARILYIEE